MQLLKILDKKQEKEYKFQKTVKRQQKSDYQYPNLRQIELSERENQPLMGMPCLQADLAIHEEGIKKSIW